jgi:dihydroxyacid dehydratase/phosphogluconate dehydratase
MPACREDDFYPALQRGEIIPGTVVIFRYQGPKGAPGMPEVREVSQHVLHVR